MKAQKRLLPALVLSAFAAFAAPSAQAQSHTPFSNVYVFGDSLSDAGYYRPFLLASGVPASLVSQLGRFTTNPGPVWAELVAAYYGVENPRPSNAGGTIFAQGGARVAENSAATPPGGAQRPASTQVTEYLGSAGGAADPNALYAIWAGGNDFLQNSQALAAGAINAAQLQANVLGAATAEIGQILRLRNAGARYILVFGLPDIGAAPAVAAGGAASAAGATAISAGYNTTLFTGLAAQGVKVIPVDVFALLNEIRANAAAYGFTNTTGVACGAFPPFSSGANSQFCLNSNLVAPDAATTYLFADGVHPTTAVHRIIADFVEALIDGPLQYSLLGEAALAARNAQIRTINDNLLSARRNDVGRLGVFVAGSAGRWELDAGLGGYTGTDTNVRGLTVGVTMRASDAVTVGLAYGKGSNKGNFGRNAGRFELEEDTWSAFASMRWGGFYGSGVLSIGDIDYNDVRRNFDIGQVLRTASSRPQGSNSSAFVGLGYDFNVGRLQIGPTVSVTAQNVDVNGFDEAGAGTASLRIYDQKRRSEIWSAGVRAAIDLGGWTPWVRVTADKERRDDERFVSATPSTMIPIGIRYDLPAYRPDNNFMTASVGLTGTLARGIGLSLAYTNVSGRSGWKEDAFSGVVSVSF